MQAFAIPRLDPGAEGIHLVWSWPDDLPISVHGYDVQRIDGREVRWAERCETITRPIIDFLRARAELPMALGPLRMRQGARFAPVTDARLYSASDDSGDHPAGFGDPARGSVDAAVATLVARPSAVAASSSATFDEFIQELTTPVERAVVSATARIAVAIALRNGKAVASGTSGASASAIELVAPSIDTIVVYAFSPQQIEICVFDRPQDDKTWANAEYVAKGLTLPIHECDPSLTTAAQEVAKARSRLVGGETITDANFARLAATLRSAAGGAALGRSGERISLTRSDATQSYEEMPFTTQLAALALHPKARRALGFGYADRKGLVAGHTYLYRVTGRFEAADLNDTIYDVQRVPSSTVLPAAFSIRDVAFRFQKPVQIVLDPAPPSNGLLAASRRGIRIDTTGYDPSSWLLPSYDGWSAIITFPTPLSKVVLEVGAGNSFTYAGGMPWNFGSPPPAPLPAGTRVELDFVSPVLELRLAGTGTLYAVRLPSGTSGIVEVHAYTQPVTYAAEPLPDAPTVLSAFNLQQPPVTLTGPIDESTAVPPRPPVGFDLNWLPATSSTIGSWPNDLDAGPPLDAFAYMIDHRVVTPPSTYGAWEPIAADDNLTLGSRDMTPPTVRLEYGCDLNELYPAIRPRSSGAGFALHLSDVFGEEDPTTGVVRPAQPLGSYHQYQIRAVDAVGRASATPTLSNIARLEKHVPPPLPAGPQPPPPLDSKGHVTGPSGPRARAIVRGAPGLTTDDITLLGAHQNAVLLEWGWRQAERDADATAAEFRVYLTRPLDVIQATVGSVTSFGSTWQLTLTTDLPLVANELVGLWLSSGQYPFLISQNDAGTTPTVYVEKSLLQPALQPVSGPVTMGRPLNPDHQRPRGWDQRVAVYALTASDNYRHVFYDVLTLSDTHPKDAVWVGVASADAQPYVADERTSGANANRPGNESGIVTCTATARYRGRPVFTIPAPLGDVPELVTDEPTGRQVLADLDLNALLGGALPPGAPVALLRCGADQVLNATSVSGGNVVLTHPDGSQETIAFPNPTDHATVLATLNGDSPQRLANKYLLHLVAASSDPVAFFERTSGDLIAVGLTQDRLAPKPGRFIYAVRAADAVGHLSDGGGVLPIVVRVPSAAGAVKPLRRSLTTTNTSLSLTVAIAADWETTTALLFAVASPPNTNPVAQGQADLLRSPNRRDLYPNGGIRLRTSSGSILSPTLVKDLSDGDVVVEQDGTRVVTLTIPESQGAWVTVWCYALTRDGFPSFVCGPFSSGVGS